MADYIYVLVHGLFFIRQNYDTKLLELIAPDVDAKGSPNPHHLLGGVRGHLQEFKGKVDWSDIGLVGASKVPKLGKREMPVNLDSSVLQFSMSDTEITGWGDEKNFFGKFILPWPEGFYSIRSDYFERTFIYDKAKAKVGSAIYKRCRRTRNSEIGLVTCLRYEYSSNVSIPFWWPDMNLHCYFQPCMPHQMSDVNSDLQAASKCFVPAGKFDLQMDEGALKDIVTPRGRGPLPPGVDKEDDYSLEEDPERPKNLCSGAVGLLNVSPANCPNFFVGS